MLSIVGIKKKEIIISHENLHAMIRLWLMRQWTFCVVLNHCDCTSI